MVTAFNVLGFLTTVLGFAGLFSLQIPAPLAFSTMVLGLLSMGVSWSARWYKGRAPLVLSAALFAVGIIGFTVTRVLWFPLLACAFAVAFLPVLIPPFMRRRKGVPPRWVRRVEEKAEDVADVMNREDRIRD